MHADTDTPAAADAVPECVLLSDAEGQVAWASPTVRDVLGRSPAELTRTESVQSLFGPTVPTPPPVGTPPVRRTLSTTTADGEQRRVTVTVESVPVPEAVTTYRCRRIDDAQLGLGTVLSRVTDAVVALDTEWRYTYANDAAVDLLDTPRAELLGEVVWDVFPASEGTAVQEELETAMTTQEPTTLVQCSPSLGRWVEIRLFPSPTGISIYFRDVTNRKASEDDLRRERDLVTQLLRVSPLGIAVHTPDGRFTRLNERAEDVIGFDSDDLVGEELNAPLWEATYPDGEPFPDEEFPLNVVLRTGEPTFGTEMSIRRQDGAQRWLSVSAAPLRNADGDIERVVVAFEDIGDRLQHERDLEESEQRFRAVFEGTLDALVLADDDGDYLAVNGAACDLYGRDEGDLVGRNVADFAPEDYDVADAWDAFLEQGSLHGEFPLVRSDGETRVTDFVATANIAPGLHLSALRDVTERTLYERELRESEQRFRAVFEGTLDALVLTDDDGAFVDVNEAACALFGVDKGDLVGKTAADFAPDGYDVITKRETFLSQGTMRSEFALVRPDGESRTVDFAATANIAPGLHLSALRDITERKADEERLAAQRDELTRLNDINELIRGVHRTVVGATDREGVERAVCEGLVAAESYPVALTTRRTAGEALRVEHAAGLADDVLAALRADGATCLESAIDRAGAENTVTVLSGLQTDDAPHPAVRELAAAHGLHSVGNIPIEYDGVVYGVLTVGSTHTDAFTGRERTVFAELGQLLGTAIEAIQTKKLLYATAFLELDLAVSADVEPLAVLNARAGGRWALDGVVPVEAGRYLLYVDVDETPFDDIERAAAGMAGIDRLRPIDTGTRRLLELRIDQDTPVSGLVDAGGRIRDGTVEHGDARFVVDVTLDTDVRGYLDRLEGRGIDVDLLAKHEVERTTPAAWAGAETDIDLTTRQRTVLEAAYLSGYFDWPRRRTTGAELADSLDIASSTLHQHLRVASAKIFEQYFAGSATGSA